MRAETIYDNRLENAVGMLVQFARGNFAPRLAVSERDDNLNIIITGLNMLGDELQNYKSELDTKTLFLETILDTIDQIIYVINTDETKAANYMRYTFVSSPIERILGYLPEDILADTHHMGQFVHPDDKEMVLRTFASVVESGKASPCIYRVFHKTTREIVWIEDRMVPQKDRSGRVARVIGSAKDITERKTSEKLLLEQKKFTENILNKLPIDIAVLDKDHRYTFLNPSAVKDEEIREWLIGRDDFDYCLEKNVPIDLAVNRRRKFLEAENNCSDVTWLDEYTNKLGETNYKLRSFLPVLENGLFKYAIGYGVDITEIRKASIEKEKLIKELNNKCNELMQFNYIVSHNLRSPVANILGLVSLVESSISEEERFKIIKYLRTASEAVDTTLKDLNQILASRSPLNEKIERFRMSSILIEVKNNLKRQINESGAKIYFSVTPETDQLYSIKSYIQSVMYNLISNAIKYKSPERAPIIEVNIHKKNDKTVISVSDNGSGMDLTAVGDQLFGLYKRFNLCTEGKGLGLYMSKMQIESLGGSIHVDSILGTGTTFKIQI